MSGQCPTCGPTTVEQHPRRPAVTRCGNCKEWLLASPIPVPSEVAETTAGERWTSPPCPNADRCPNCTQQVVQCSDGCPTCDDWYATYWPDLAPAEPDAEEAEGWEYAIEGDWLVQVVNKHTCGTGPDGYYGAHEPGCGSIPIANIAALLDRVRREEGERIAQAIEAEGVNGMPHLFGRAAAIARAASVGRGEGQ